MFRPNVRVGVAALALSAAGFVGIALNEGYTDKAVIPIPGDVPTLGFGTTEGVKLGDKTTPPAALERALRDVSKDEGAVKRCVKVPLSQHEYDAAVQLSYNIGATAFCKSTVVKRWNAGDYAGGCEAFLMWDKAGGRVVPGLVTRRQKERALCLGRRADAALERGARRVTPAPATVSAALSRFWSAGSATVTRLLCEISAGCAATVSKSGGFA